MNVNYIIFFQFHKIYGIIEVNTDKQSCWKYADTGGERIMYLGSMIKIERLKQGMKQKELANILNISSTAVSMIENRKSYPQPQRLRTLCSTLDINFESAWKLFLAERHGIIQ